MKQNVSRKIGKKPISHEKVCQLFGPQASFEEIRQAAGRICRDYLIGRWKEVSSEQLIVKRISGGLSNFLYYVSLPQDDSQSEATDDGKATTKSSSSSPPNQNNDKNRNVADFNDLLTTSSAGDCNGNKRKRYDSSSSTMSLKHKEPKEVLLRIYGQSHGEDALEQMITESVVFALLSERNFGPRLYGIFPGGRIEQYIPARALMTAELSIPDISLKIAEKMAEIHTLNIPMSKEPDWLYNCMERWLCNLPDILARTDWSEQEASQYMRDIDYDKEITWMKSIIRQGNHPVMFCHNDLQEGNILFRTSSSSSEYTAEDAALENMSANGDDPEMRVKPSKPVDLDSSGDSAIDSINSSSMPDLRIIDFEYCAYNYRGFDLANHFLEWTFNYCRQDYPYYNYNRDDFPTTEQRHRFIKRYLKKLYESREDWEPSQEEINEVDAEVKVFRMMSHLFWSLWSLINVTSNIEFGYWNYAVCRMKEYQDLKREFINCNNMNV